jgi:RHS repeat-associated protein
VTDKLYTGQQQETEIGLDYYSSRFYDPVIAHFVKTDSVISNPGDSKSFDRYSYVSDNPIRYNDPSGHRFSDNVDPIEKRIITDTYLKNSGTLPTSSTSYIPPVVSWIYNQMVNNAQSQTVVAIHHLLNDGYPNGVASAFVMWTLKVYTGRPWDQKGEIQDLYKMAGSRTDYLTIGDRQYHYDIWSNIHYGYVGMAAGFSEQDLLNGAGAARIGATFFSVTNKYGPLGLIDGKFSIQPRAGVTGLKAYDQAPDSAAIQIGIDLYKQYGLDLKPEDILTAVENSNELHTKPLGE